MYSGVLTFVLHWHLVWFTPDDLYPKNHILMIFENLIFENFWVGGGGGGGGANLGFILILINACPLIIAQCSFSENDLILTCMSFYMLHSMI